MLKRRGKKKKSEERETPRARGRGHVDEWGTHQTLKLLSL